MVGCLIYITVVLLKLPYVNASLDTLSLFCMAELMLISCLAHLLPAVGEWQGTYIDDLLSTILLGVAFVLFLYTLLQLVKATRWLVRHPAVRRLLRKSQTSRFRVSSQFNSALGDSELMEGESEQSILGDSSRETIDATKPATRTNRVSALELAG